MIAIYGRRLALFLCVILLVLLGLFPGAFLEGDQLGLVKGWIGRSRYAYRGEVTLWHVSGDGMGMGNGSAFLSARAKEFERKNFGIYFKIEVMDAPEYRERRKAGECADILSFSQGLLDSPEGTLCALVGEDLSVTEDLLSSGEWKNQSYGIPYYYGGAVLVTNDDLIYSSDLMPPSGLPDEAWLEEARKKGALTLMRIGERCDGYLVASKGLCEEATAAFLSAPEGSVNEFLSGKTLMAVMDLKSLYALKQREESGYLPGISIVPLGNLALSTQYIGIFEGIPEERKRVAEGFITVLFSKKNQQRLLDYWCWPTADHLDDAIPEDLRMAALWEENKGETPLCLPAFRGGEILKELKEKLGAGEEVKRVRQWLTEACNRGR